ncbi:MAG: hypothetical protein HKN40_06735 [Winogradskyella sp.]|uniref:hypothetical protein n=1 Tax=Winogradskyella sp. TaxID=1883156 RepID=UPI0017FD3BF4|nr:hypothetical protein [Winogradskyella sp.]
MRSVNLVIALIIGCLLFSCSESETKTADIDTQDTAASEPAISSRVIEGFEYDDYALSREAMEVVGEWEKYQELAIQIDYLKKADLAFFNSDKKLLEDFITELKANMPERITTNPIISRVSIIETKLLKLNENLTISNIDAATKLESIKEVLVAFSNLTLQINKKLEFDLYNSIEVE